MLLVELSRCEMLSVHSQFQYPPERSGLRKGQGIASSPLLAATVATVRDRCLIRQSRWSRNFKAPSICGVSGPCGRPVPDTAYQMRTRLSHGSEPLHWQGRRAILMLSPMRKDARGRSCGWKCITSSLHHRPSRRDTRKLLDNGLTAPLQWAIRRTTCWLGHLHG